MNKNLKRRAGLLLVMALWLGLCLWAWSKPAQTISESERRPLAQMPRLTGETLTNGSFMRDFSKYAVDQFPLRDGFRQMKALYTYHVLGQKDNNGIYLHDGYAAKMEYPLNEGSVQYACDRFRALYQGYLQKTGSKVYFAMVPDKSYYLAREAGVLSMDYAALTAMLQEQLPFAEFIDLTDALELSDYYRTDTHWKQPCLSGVVEVLGEAMGFEPPTEVDSLTATEEFLGVYAGQSAMPMQPEVLDYLTFPGWTDVTVFSADTQKTTGLYDLDKLDSRDPYEVFLGGNMAVQILRNPHADPEKKLIVFRDSFGSSLAPWLAASYGEITLVDTRYIAPAMLRNFVSFEGQDVLMLYSALVLNSSGTLRK